MRPIQVHPLSALLGAAVLAIPFALASFQGMPNTPSSPQRPPIPVSVQEMPDPHNMVVVREEDGPYTVPNGKLFVFTGFGRADGPYVQILVDGQVEMESGDHVTHSIMPVPPGYAVRAGSVITAHAETSPANGRAWGYLVDA